MHYDCQRIAKLNWGYIVYGNIKRLRELQGLSQQQLADMTNIAQAQISKYEKGRIAQPSFASLSAIANALGVHVEELADTLPDHGKLSSQQFQQLKGKTQRYVLRDVKSPQDMIPFLSEEITMHLGKATLFRDDDTVISYQRRPVAVDGDWPMYSMKQYGDEMEPRIKRGETIIAIDDGRWDVGSEVSVVLKDAKWGRVAILRTVAAKDDTSITFKCYNSDETFTISMDDIIGVHRVFGTVFNMQ